MLFEAIRSACSLVGNEPFAVILPDVLIDAPIPCTRQLISCYERHPGCIIATRTIDPAEADRFGVLDVVPLPDAGDGRTLRVVSVTERPQPGSPFSHYGIFGRYILDPAIFSCIERTRAVARCCPELSCRFRALDDRPVRAVLRQEHHRRDVLVGRGGRHHQ